MLEFSEEIFLFQNLIFGKPHEFSIIDFLFKSPAGIIGSYEMKNSSLRSRRNALPVALIRRFLIFKPVSSNTSRLAHSKSPSLNSRCPPGAIHTSGIMRFLRLRWSIRYVLSFRMKHSSVTAIFLSFMKYNFRQ